ncbi:MAG: O-antigen ligase family protein [Prevotellaceae bacterium]|jgi:O-antigen ligase|nr:O-antigen ligase family protein [Prevotellaceae bacterium]
MVVRVRNILLTVIFALMCAGSLFPVSLLFVNEQVTPKWYCTVFCLAALLLTYVAFSFSAKGKTATAQIIFPVILVLCIMQAAYGLLQYIHVLPGDGGFHITGSFDNPAGFAASLCAGLPVMFYSVLKNRTLQNRITIITATIIVAAILLSGSRSGMASMLAVCMVISLYEFPKNRKLKVILFSVVFLLFSGLYFLKKDSADGRLLIWRCSWEMIRDQPVFGHGCGGFKAGYMDYQAGYFEHHPDSKYAMLADNVNRPFNEYILLLTNYGFAGFVLFLAVCWFVWKSFLRCRHEPVVRLAGCGLLSVAVFAFFSYPLTYPFVWIMVILSIAIILYHAKYPVKIPVRILFTVKILLIPAILFFGWKTYQRMSNEMLWCKIARQSLSGRTERMLPEYERLRPVLSGNELFLYNYTAELNVTGHYDKSLQVGKACERLWADYDLQMLLADNYLQLQQYDEAERHYRKASQMCPVKFMPLYRLAKLYEERGNRVETLRWAELILGKRIKISSPTINAIRQEMKQLIEKDSNPASESRTDAESVNKPQSRQDNLSEQRTPEELLPP